MYRFASEAKHKIGAISVGQLYANLCSQNREFSQNYILMLIGCISDYDYDN